MRRDLVGRARASRRLAWAAAAVLALLSGCAPAAVAQATTAVGGLAARTLAADEGAEDVQLSELSVVVDPPAAHTAGIDPDTADEVAVGRPTADGRRVSAPVELDGYQTVGVTWPEGVAGDSISPQVRSRVEGVWGDWVALQSSDAAPDSGSADAVHAADLRDGTDTLWLAGADAVQLSVEATVAETDDVHLALVGSDSDTDGTTETVGSLTASLTAGLMLPAASAPAVVTRDQWGATPPSCAMNRASSLVGVVLHHTAGSNTYSTRAEAMQQLRNDQRYHMESRGWCDLGYNFVVDKWGTIYEGRAGSLTEPVVGVHAGGFNTGTVGIAMLGTYSQAPSSETIRSVAQIVGWKLQPYGVDPTGTMSFYTAGGENSRYAGQTVTLPRVFGHRDVAYTACPGDGGYASLPAIRSLARGYAGPMFAAPSVSASTVPAGTAVTVSAPTISDINWTLRVTDDRTGMLMRTETGLATEAAGGVRATWTGATSAGAVVGAGPYRLTLTGTDARSGQAANTYSTVVTVTGSTEPAVVQPVALGADLTFVPITPVRVLDTRTTGQSLGANSRVDVAVAGVGGVPADARAVALNVTAVNPSAVSWVRGWPAGSTEPASSLLNASSAQAAVAASTVLGVGGEGKISLRNSAGSTHLVVDVTGYYVASGGVRYGQLATAARLLDTRQSGRIASGTTRTLTVAGTAGVPADATAVALNVVSVGATGQGYVSVQPTGSTPGTTSTVNHQPGQNVANRAIVALANGAVDVTVAGGAADVVVDVVGWYGPGGALRLTPVVPQRVVDTRTSSPLQEGETRTFPITAGLSGAGGASAAIVSLTATQQTAGATYVTVWPAGSGRPATSDLNTGSGRDQANGAVVGWDGSGRIAAYNDRGSTHLIVDVNALLG